MRTYCIKRFYQNDSIKTEIIERGLTLQQAMAHCDDPNTSSRHAKAKWATAITEKYGPWFDGYEIEPE